LKPGDEAAAQSPPAAAVTSPLLAGAHESYSQFANSILLLQQESAELLAEATEAFSLELSKAMTCRIDADQIPDFLSQPFMVDRIAANDYLVHVPVFMSHLHAGWLTKQTKSYRTYRFNIFSVFGTDGPPEWLKEHITLPVPPAITIEESDADDGEGSGSSARSYLLAPELSRADVMAMFPNLLLEEASSGRYLIRGLEELFLVRMILVQKGLLLQKTCPVAPDMMDSKRADELVGCLRPHQQQVYDEFCAYGKVGSYLPPRAGKTFIGVYITAAVGAMPVLVIAPTKALVAHWQSELEAAGLDNAYVTTYHVVNSPKKLAELVSQGYNLIIFDECHRLPANTFRYLACLDADYILGLSATAFREDGQEANIYALTGKPVFCDWGQYFDEKTGDGTVIRPSIKIKILPNTQAKINHLLDMTTLEDQKPYGNTLVFVEKLATGKMLGELLQAPFYHGANQPPKGEQIFQPENSETGDDYGIPIPAINLVIMSKIGDEGLQFDGLTRVIVFESMGDSRRQELQRLGRLLGNAHESEYVMLLTREERQKHEKRVDELFALEGFVIEETQV
jgi:hypothetical protein